MNILYEDTSLVVLDKPAGLTSEEGVPAALRQRWGRPDAYVGVIHRLDTGVSGLMVYARTPGAAAALTKQVTESQQAYAILDGRAEAGPGAPAQPCFLKTYRAVIAGGPDEQLPPEGILRDYLFKDSRKGRVFPVKRPRKGVREAILEYRIVETAPDGSLSLAEITLHTGRTHQIRVQFASRKHPLYGDGKYGSRFKGNIALQSAGLQFVHPETGKPMAFSLPLPAAGVLRDYLFKDSRKGRVFPVSRPRKGVREAVLEYRILATAGENSLAEITLHTGRTHQIRVQFASRRHPLYGDGKYGSRQKGSIALQSCGLRFVHPDTGKPMAFSLPLPAAAPWKEFLEPGE